METEPMPQTKTLRRDLAQGIRNDLSDYRREVHAVLGQRILYRLCKHMGSLVRMEGLDLDEAKRELVKGYTGR